jgi:hypothetical protein
MQVPLRLALTDHPGEEESNALLADSAPWSARLAAKLLRERAKGADSPWRAYIAVLPEAVQTPVAWPWELISKLKYEQAAERLHDAAWVVESAAAELRGEAIGKAEGSELDEDDLERFRCTACDTNAVAAIALALPGFL